MAPEYVIHGHLLTKADVYSFGVLLLEIISGRKNNDFISDNGQPFLVWVWINLYILPILNSKIFYKLLIWIRTCFVLQAWNLYRGGNFTGILDERLKASCDYEQVVRCVNVGFLCTQGDPSLRLPMSEIIMMLSSNSARLPTPTMPAFFNISQNYGHENSSEVSSQHRNSSPSIPSLVLYGMSARDSITTLEPR